MQSRQGFQHLNPYLKPIPLPQEVLTAMKNDLSGHEQINRTAEIQGLNDTELLNLYQQVTQYFLGAPPQPPHAHLIQELKSELNQITLELNDLGHQQEQKFGEVQKIISHPLGLWNSSYPTAAKEVELLLKKIGDKLEIKEIKESQIQQLTTRAETYSQWKNQPQSIRMMKLLEVLNSPQMHSRIVQINNAAIEAKQTAANLHQQSNPHPDPPAKRSGFGR